jgi:hypothetical protein
MTWKCSHSAGLERSATSLPDGCCRLFQSVGGESLIKIKENATELRHVVAN